MTDPGAEKVWAFCEAHGLPVIVHAGEDIGFEPPFHSEPSDFAEVQRRHPALTLIAAHLGGWRNWDKVERDLVGTTVYIDTAFVTPYMPYEQFRRIIVAHGVDHVLYGTDSPWQDLRDGMSQIQKLGLSPAETETVFYGNAKRLWSKWFPQDE